MARLRLSTRGVWGIKIVLVILAKESGNPVASLPKISAKQRLFGLVSGSELLRWLSMKE